MKEFARFKWRAVIFHCQASGAMKGKIFVDHLRNLQGRAYSAANGATVSCRYMGQLTVDQSCIFGDNAVARVANLTGDLGGFAR